MARPKTATLTGLMRVKAGRVLRWPNAIMAQENHPLNVRGKGGYVVDADKPYEAILLFGMGKFLEPVPESEHAAARARLDDTSLWPRPIIGFLADKGLLKRKPPVRRSAKDKLAANAAAQAIPPPDLLPGLDEAPRRTQRKPKPTSDAEGADI